MMTNVTMVHMKKIYKTEKSNSKQKKKNMDGYYFESV
jgi:hypothetical protein